MRRIASPLRATPIVVALSLLFVALTVLGACASKDRNSMGLSDNPAPPPTAPPKVGPTTPNDLRRVNTDLTIDEADEVVEGIDVEGRVYINASTVTLRNFRAWGVVIAPDATDIVIEDGEIHGGDEPYDGVSFGAYTARRLEVHRVIDAFKANGDTVIEDCYVHDLGVFSGAEGVTHNDGVQMSVGSRVLIRRNWIERPGTNSAVFIDADQGPISQVVIESNYLDGGSFTLWVVRSTQNPENGYPTNVTVRANRFGNGGEYGAAVTGPGTTFSADNVDDAGNPIIPKPDPSER